MIPKSKLRVVTTCCLLMAAWYLAGCGHNSSAVKNRLANASSPYLREHADNPVDWYEWGDEALGRAQREGKPLLISIGYSSCHWCHVMEAETFMDTAVARVMNQNFICVKVDREERPDIDQIFINAAQLISGNAGWPLNAFALPDGRPFFAATYFPKEQWLRLLEQITESYQNDERSLRKQAAAVIAGVRNEEGWRPQSDSVSQQGISQQAIFHHWKTSVDMRLGGLTGAPKFPMPVIWEFMLQYHHLSKSDSALQMTLATLDGMRRGGIYDQLGGGFARYATDSLWHIPHFEKMLYDNAQLVQLYAQAYQITQNGQYETTVRETLAFIKTELTSSEGLFYASINADSEGKEGSFYAWSREEIDDALDTKNANLFCAAFNVTAAGNWEPGKNVLYRNAATQDDAEHIRQLDQFREKLLSVRNKRKRPTTDDKILTSWNAMMIEAYVRAFVAFGDTDYLSSAVAAAGAIQKNRIDPSGHVWRTKDDSHPPIEGFLDDYAFLCRAFIRLYQATFDIRHLQTARLLADYTLKNFKDAEHSLFFYSLDKTTQQIARKVDTSDEVIPSSNAVLAEALFLLGNYYQSDVYLNTCKSMITAMTGRLSDEGPYYASWARLKGMVESDPFEVAIVGPDAASKRNELMKAYLPTTMFYGGDEENLPLLENKNVPGKTLIYVCRRRVCKFPVEDVDAALKLLDITPMANPSLR
jgi:uncharacterized protein YyaL (SSP411 family)